MEINKLTILAKIDDDFGLVPITTKNQNVILTALKLLQLSENTDEPLKVIKLKKDCLEEIDFGEYVENGVRNEQ